MEGQRNRPEALAIGWAAWRSGLYLTPMSTALTTTELRYLVEDCDARAVVNARLEYWRPLAEDQRRMVTANLPERRLPVGMSALELGDVIDICIDNVFAHTEEGTAFAVSLEQVGDQAVLVISDRGAGFAEYPSLPRPGTSGMGLHLARRSVQSAGGTLETSPWGQPGAEVRISIPLAAGAPAAGEDS